MSDKVIEGKRSFLVGEQPMLNDQIQKFISDKANGLKYTFLAAAAGLDTPFPAGSVEEEFRNSILTRNPEVRNAYSTKARQIANASEQTRRAMFGRYGDLKVEEFRKAGIAGLTKNFPPLVIDSSTLKGMIKLPEQKPQGTKDGKKQGFIKFTMPSVKALRFFITEVKCIDETNPENSIFGINIHDEIHMGGISVDPSGNTKKISPFLIRDDFDDGIVKTYPSPGKEFCGFTLNLKNPWPKNFAAVVFIAEKDWGGFAKGISSAMELASPFIKEGITMAGGSFGILGSIFAKVVTEIFDALIGWIIDIFADDIFLPGKALAGLHTPVALVYKDHGGWQNFASQLGEFTFAGHGGVYTVKCQWRIEVEQ